MEHTLIKGKIDFSGITSNTENGFIHFKPNNSSLFNKVSGNYFYEPHKPLALLLDGVDVIQMEFEDKKEQEWWQTLSENHNKTNYKPVSHQLLNLENEFNIDAFILVNRLISENHVPAFLFLGKTNTSDGHTFTPQVSTIKKSMNSMILSRLNSSSFNSSLLTEEEQPLKQATA